VSADVFKTDLRLVFPRGEQADLAGERARISFSRRTVAASGAAQDQRETVEAPILETVSGVDNLVQALTLRLLVDQGELAGLGHPHYGSRIRDLMGETLDRANLELLRRYVRQTLLADARVAEVLQVQVTPHPSELGRVDVRAQARAVSGDTAAVEVSFNAL
jgi:phage baseplate assembly protein W